MFRRTDICISLFVVLAAGICTPQVLRSQTQEPLYSVSVYSGLGYTMFLSELDYELLSKGGFAGTARIMWEPEHRLSVGMESGYLQLYRFENPNVGVPPRTFSLTSNLDAVPILAVFSMRIVDNFKLSVGSGMFILFSHVDAVNNPVISSQLSTGSYFGANYYYRLSDILSLGGEVKYYYIHKIEDGALTMQLAARIKLLSY